MTLAAIKRHLRKGLVFDVTVATGGPGDGTVRATVTATFPTRFHLAHPLDVTTVHWPAARQVSMDAAGVIRLAGPTPMTLTPVRGARAMGSASPVPAGAGHDAAAAIDIAQLVAGLDPGAPDHEEILRSLIGRAQAWLASRQRPRP